MNYRSDIDGLRAIAVLSVIAYHLSISFPHHVPVVPGGFVGVDVFFVISGYLITRTIYEDIGRGTYSIIEFYNRRVRRIFPALFVVFLFVLWVAFFTDFPAALSEVQASLLSAIFFVSNIQFYNSSGYFDQTLQNNPLLHTWSLSIEEQFYVLFPILIFALRGLSHSTRVKVMLLICAASLAYAEWKVRIDREAAFYLVWSRAWELLLGSLLAIGNVPKPTARWQVELLGLLGLGLILVSDQVLSSDLPFPGLLALLPCLGAAAILQSGAFCETFTGRLLGSQPLRFLGQISYSLYLWHWPLIVFFRAIREPTDLQRFALFGLCVVMASLSWWLVERPFRARPYRLGASATMAAAAGLMALGSALAAIAAPVNAAIWPLGAKADRLLAYQYNDPQRFMRGGVCFLTSRYDAFAIYDRGTCLATDPSKKNFLIVGDSHAAHLWLGLQTVFKDVNFLQATASGCKPVLQAVGSLRCTSMMKFVFASFVPSVRLDGVILSARWDDDMDVEAVRETAVALRRYADKVYVFGPIVEYDRPLPQILARGVGSDQAALAAKHRLPYPYELDQRFAARLSDDSVRYVSVYRMLCHQQCAIWAGEDVPLQFDGSHLTRDGSIYLASHLDPDLFQAGGSSGPP